jgi:hypothetical protein
LELDGVTRLQKSPGAIGVLLFHSDELRGWGKIPHCVAELPVGRRWLLTDAGFESPHISVNNTLVRTREALVSRLIPHLPCRLAAAFQALLEFDVTLHASMYVAHKDVAFPKVVSEIQA